MVKQKKGICDQIKTLQSNLKNAEENFKSHNGTRGELDLMLAEAQMQFLREKRGSKSFWARQTLAVCIAAILVFVGVGSWFWAKSTMKPNELASAQGAPMVTVAQQPEKQVQAAKQDAVPVNVNAMVTKDSDTEYKIKETEPLFEKQKVVTTQVVRSTPLAETQDMRDLVRIARKKLSESN
jgi:hypothetical protein